MNINDRSGLVLLHSPAAFAPAGHGHDIAAAIERPQSCPECGLPSRLELSLSAPGGSEKLAMTPCDSFENNGRRFEIYSCRIPAALMTEGKLRYVIEGGGCRGEYLLDIVKLPALPPFIITEIFNRPKDKNVTSYLELYNTGGADVDLYGWELLIMPQDAAAPKRLPLSPREGENILRAGEVAVWWPLYKRNFKVGTDARDYTTPADFCDAMNVMYRPPVPELDPGSVRIMPIDPRETDPESGEKVYLRGLPELPTDYSPCTLYLVPRGADADAAVYSLTYNNVWGEWDCPVRRSSVWTVDVRRPSEAVNIAHASYATPGTFDEGQGVLDPSASLPVILPVAPADAVYLGDAVHEITFAAVPTDACRPVSSAWVMLTLESGDKMRIPAHEQDDGLYHAVIPLNIIERLTRLVYSLHASDGTREVALATKLSAAVYDNVGPRVLGIHPTSKYAYDINAGTPVWADFYDISGVKLSECRLFIDDKELTGRAEWSAVRMSYDPPKPFAVGEHRLRLELCDMLGNHTEKRVSFSVSDLSELNAYRGEVHCHTGASDGTGTPDDAYKYARDVGGVDYFAVTEHSHYHSGSADSLIETADRYDDPGRFAALWGYEMTWNMMCGYWGHMNVIGSRKIEHQIYETSMPELYRKLEADPDAVAMFNHPGLAWGNFDEYAFRTDSVDKKVCLAEIRSSAYDLEYAAQLAAGWHAAPVSNEDNHSPNWTTAQPQIGFVLAPSLTRDNIMDAFRARRTYTASEPTLKIKYRVNGKWLGSHLEDPDRLCFDISISTENERGIGKVEIVAEDNIVVAVRDAGVLKHFEWKPVLSPDFDYYYLRITAPKQYSVTAPVWIDHRPALALGAPELGASYNPDRGASARLRLTNGGSETAENVRVDFYLGAVSGFDLQNTEPYSTVHCGKLPAGKTLKVSRSFPELSGARRLSAVVTADIAGKKHATSTVSTFISPVTVTEVLPCSMPLERDGITVADPFPYVSVYNSSPRELDLGGASLRLWSKTGKPPYEERCWTFPADVKLPPRSGLTVWVRYENSDLTVDDFNERYGTALVEGKDLIICDKHITSSSPFGRRLDLVLDGEVVSRVHWNYGATFDGEAHHGRARRYVKLAGLSVVSSPLGLYDPTPGLFTDEQTRNEFSALPTRKETRQKKKDDKTDAKRNARKERLRLTDGEAAAIAAASAAVSGGVAAVLGVLGIRKKRSSSEKRKK